MPLTAQAALSTRTPARIADAMRARPELVGGDGADDTALMRLLPGWIAKRGAEGLLCAVSPDGRGYAFKVADGNGRGASARARRRARRRGAGASRAS